MWFGAMFTILVEVRPAKIESKKNYTHLSNQLLLIMSSYEFPRLHLRQFAQLHSGLRSSLWKILVAISRSSSIHSVS